LETVRLNLKTIRVQEATT